MIRAWFCVCDQGMFCVCDQGLKLLKKARSDGKLEIVTRKEAGRPVNMRKVFRSLERVSDDDADDREEDVDEIVDMEQKIKSVAVINVLLLIHLFTLK